jgi:hypothetical protein
MLASTILHECHFYIPGQQLQQPWFSPVFNLDLEHHHQTDFNVDLSQQIRIHRPEQFANLLGRIDSSCPRLHSVDNSRH